MHYANFAVFVVFLIEIVMKKCFINYTSQITVRHFRWNLKKIWWLLIAILALGRAGRVGSGPKILTRVQLWTADPPRALGAAVKHAYTRTAWYYEIYICWLLKVERTKTLVSGVAVLSASSSSKADTLNVQCKTCRMWLLGPTLDNIWDNKHVVSCCSFLKMCCCRSRLVFNCCF